MEAALAKLGSVSNIFVDNDNHVQKVHVSERMTLDAVL